MLGYKMRADEPEARDVAPLSGQTSLSGPLFHSRIGRRADKPVLPPALCKTCPLAQKLKPEADGLAEISVSKLLCLSADTCSALPIASSNGNLKQTVEPTWGW